MSGSSSLLRSSREGSALFLLSLIIAWENPCSPLLQSTGAAWQQALVGALLGGLGCRMPGELPVSSSGESPMQMPLCRDGRISHTPSSHSLQPSCPASDLISGISPSLRHVPVASSPFPGNTEAGVVYSGQENSSDV